MWKKVVLWAILGAAVAILGALVARAQTPADLFGLTIWRDDGQPREIHCRFLYRAGTRGVHKVNADQFCQQNITAIKALGRAAFDYADANPIIDPAAQARLDEAQIDLEAAGYTVTPP
jgi:hypothetical protein